MAFNDLELGPKWYVAHTYAGYENKVKQNLEKIVENRSLQSMIFDVQIPVEVETEINGDETKEIETKIFPSYVLVKMIMTDETWHVVRNIRGVTGFVGPGSRPVPLSDEEVAALGIDTEKDENKQPTVKLGFAVGDTIQIFDGLLAGNTGIVEEISADGKTVTVRASMFGRETSIELGVESVKRLAE